MDGKRAPVAVLWMLVSCTVNTQHGSVRLLLRLMVHAVLTLEPWKMKDFSGVYIGNKKNDEVGLNKSGSKILLCPFTTL